MRVCIPDMGLVGILEFTDDIYEKVPSDEAVFDFSKMHNFNPLPMLIMGATMHSYRMQYPGILFRIHGYEEKSYTGTIGFLKYISGSIDIGKMPGETNGSENYIPITLIKIDELQQDETSYGSYMVVNNLIEKETGRLARIASRGNKELHKLLTYLIKEIL